MDLELFFPRRRKYWDSWDWPQRRSLMDWSDPWEELMMPSLALEKPMHTVQKMMTSELANDSNKFSVRMDCSHFKPEEIEVKTIDNNLIIHGKHEEKMDKHGWVSREFTRRYTLPEECETNGVKSSLNSSGVLTIEAPKKPMEPLKDNERVIPIKVMHELPTPE